MNDAGTRAKCPKCGAGLRVRKDLVGRSVRCTNCQAVLRVGAGSVPKPPVKSTGAAPSEFVDFNLPVRKPAPARRVGIGVGLVTLALAAVAAGLAWVKRPVDEPRPPIAVDPTPVIQPPAPPATYPPLRRAMAVFAGGYLNLSPVRVGPPQKNIEALLNRLGERWGVPNDQSFLVADVAGGRPANPPIKAVVEPAVVSFLTAARAQDTAILVFVGHAAAVDGKPYLVPLDGDLSRPATLIGLNWLYERLRECRARQRLLVVDVCRHDPDRPAVRPVSAPMSADLEAALKSPPPGVQVWSACSVGQSSMECNDVEFENEAIEGGVFLNQFFRAFVRGAARRPNDDELLPLDTLVQPVTELTRRFARGARKLDQTPFLAGTVDPQRLAAPPESVSPRAVQVLTARELFAGELADAALVRGIVKDIRLPSIRLEPADRGELPVPFFAKALAEYSTEGAAAPTLKDGVRRAVGVLRRHGEGVVIVNGVRKTVGAPRERLAPPVNDALKRRILKEQADGPGIMFAELEAELTALQKLTLARQAEPSPRWQANYDFVTAAVKARIAHINEYNFVLGKIRKDELPALTPGVHGGWRLEPTEKLSAPRDVRDLADEARQAFDRLIRERPGTPWEVLARRERVTLLGLQWQPVASLPK